MFEKKIRAIMILEMLGRPKEHIINVMNQLVQEISTVKIAKVINSKVHDAKPFENKDKNGKIIPGGEDLFTTFAEIEVEVNTPIDLLGLCFQYMPANVEVIEPEDFKFKNIDFNSMVNEILRRLHNYDAVAKSALMNNQLLAKKLNEMQEEKNNRAVIQDSSISLTTNPEKKSKAAKKPVKKAKKK